MKTLVILHGWQSSKEKWQKVKEGIEKASTGLVQEGGVKVIVPDIPGFKPENELKKPWNLDNYVDWLDRFCQEKRVNGELVEPFFLSGHSFGGALAAKFTARYPEKIDKLFLVASSCIRRKTIKKWFLGRVSKILKIFAFLPFFNLARKAFYKFVVGPTDYLNAKGELKQTFLNIISEDLSSSLPLIKVPTVIIWGKEDKATLLEDAYLINKKISNSKLVIIPDKGHSLQKEAPEILVKKVLENLRSVGFESYTPN